MTSDVEDILEAARSLPPRERLEVLRGLAESLAGAYPPLEAAAAEFWTPRLLDELASERHTPVVTDIHALAMPDWPVDEGADDVITYLHEQRHAARGVKCCMQTLLLDTDVFLFLLRGDSRANAYATLIQGHRLALSFMTVAELFQWAAVRKWGTRRSAHLERALTSYLIVPVDIETCRISDKCCRDEARESALRAQSECEDDVPAATGERAEEIARRTTPHAPNIGT